MSQTMSPQKHAIPPGPRAPAWWQLVRFAGDPLGLLDECHRRYGDAFTLHVAGNGRFVMLSDPDAVREVSRADPDVLHSGEANSLFTATVGRHSVLVLDGARPKIVHIAASLGGCPNRSLDEMGEKAIAEYDRKLDEIANEMFGQLPHRKYSKRSGYPTPLALVTVVGYRKPTRWEFYAQERSKEGNVPRTMVRQIVTTTPVGATS